MKAVIRAARPCRAARALLALLLCAFTLVQPALAASASAPRLRVVPGLAEPLVASRPTSAAEDAALDAALAAFKAPADPAADFPERAASLEAFAREHPRSGWRGAILANLGVGYYQAGYFSRAMAAWEQAWEAARDTRVDASPAARALADRALGELARMHARLGRADDLQALLTSIRGREVTGGATELIAGAREALWNFRNDPGRSFLCGPMALRNLLVSAKAPASRIDLMDAQRSGPDGFSLTQVSDLARRAGIAHRLIHRQGGQAIPVPSVVHWKLDHYAAIVAQQDGRYLVQDPTFASGDTWVSERAIEEESSGYFLVPEGMGGAARAPGDPGWRLASAQEARRIHGKGQTSNSESGNTTSEDDDTSPCAKGMCQATAKRMLVSLNLTDTPVGYNPPKGPPVQIRLSYNQRESGQPAVFGFFNVSPKWSMSVLSWIEDDPARPGNGVVRFAAGGGYVGPQDYVNYDSASGTFRPERKSGAVLARLPATGAAASYELRHSDGSRHVFAHADGATARPRRMFLSRIIDPAGNALTFNYDAQLRLASITDATGRHTTFSYDAPASPLLVSRITDPFGRHADLGYDGQGRLVSITDVIGITSAFSYDAGGLVNSMTTPYGTSRFAYGQSAAINGRYLEITDPLGLTERLEFRHGAAGIPASEAAVPSVQGPLANNNLNNRNTFYWDKHAQAVAPGQYAAARITHWLHNPAGLTSPIVESTKAPLESRVWRQYPGQTGSGFHEGSSGLPHRISRVLDGGITQLTRFERNVWGKPTAVTDPAGRILRLGYADNGIDLVSVQRQGPTGAAETLATFTYDHRHLPLTHTDAAGQTTRYAWDGAGLLESVTDPLGQATRYVRDGLGRLTAIVNPDGSTRLALAYDAFDRVARSTDSEGYARTFEYDALDRLTRVSYPDGTSTEYTYDRLDLVAVRDRLGRTTRYAWDANRRLVGRTDPLGQTTAYAWHPNGALAAITDPKGNTTAWDIDLQGRPVAKRHADGSTETYAWNISGQLAAVTDAQGQRRTYAYTVDGLPAAIGYPGAQVPTAGVSYGYDPVHPRVTTMTDGVGTTTYAWHPAGTPGALQLAGITVPVAGAGGLSETQSYTYDALGRPSGRSIASSQGQGQGAVETFGYDALGRRIAHGNPLGEFRYSHLGASARVTGVRSANGPLVQMRYDTPLGDLRLRGISYADASGHPLAGYGYRYDAEGSVLAFADALPGKALEGAIVPPVPSSLPPAAVSLRAVALGMPLFASAALAALALAIALWPARRLRQSRLRRWARVGAPLLALSLAASCGGGGSGGTGGWWPGGSGGDGVGGGPVGTAPGPGTGAGSGTGGGDPGSGPGAPAEPRAWVTTYTYDAAERLTSASTALDLSGSPAGPLRRFEWDAASNLVGIAVGDSTRQLPANATNALAEGSYDASGNPLKLGASTFQWDGAHRLVEHDNGTVQSSFTYDGRGRIVRIVERMGGAVVADRAYVWCGTVRCVERDNTLAGSPVTRRYFEQGVLDLRTGSEPLYYAQDALGSVRQLIDAQGNVRARYDYEPFGQRSRTEGDLESQLGFAGLWRHEASGLDLAVWRGYDASRGRWLNRDPIGEDGGLNLYGYAAANPARYTDPEGLNPAAAIGAACAANPAACATAAFGTYCMTNPSCRAGMQDVAKQCVSAAERIKDRLFSEGDAKDTLQPGPHSGDSIPARGPGRQFTDDERDAINDIGGQTGCHTCGTKEPGTPSGNFIPDHQPPNALNPDGAPQSLYPHCLGCSRTQGGQVRGRQRSTRGR